MSTAIVDLCVLFCNICAKTIHTSDLNQLQTNIEVALRKLDKIFLPTFFNVMEHLVVHLPYEIKAVGLVSYSCMYPIERGLHTLKQHI